MLLPVSISLFRFRTYNNCTLMWGLGGGHWDTELFKLHLPQREQACPKLRPFQTTDFHQFLINQITNLNIFTRRSISIFQQPNDCGLFLLRYSCILCFPMCQVKFLVCIYTHTRPIKLYSILYLCTLWKLWNSQEESTKIWFTLDRKCFHKNTRFPIIKVSSSEKNNVSTHL